MDTTQAVIARLQSGGEEPSTRTLQRLADGNGYAAANFARAGARKARGS